MASALKYTSAELDLITDPDMYLMVKYNTRGEIATISQQYVRANNTLVKGYDPSKPNSWITHLDANILYGTAMSEPLPEGNFRFLSQDEISYFDLTNVPTHGETKYIVECDLKYPEKLYELHSDYPMAPEHLTVSPDMLSDFCSELKDKNWIPSQKLILNLPDKTKYVCH